MEIIQFHIDGGLSKEDIDKIWAGACSLISSFGRRVPHAGIRALISLFDGVNVEFGIMKFKPALVKKTMACQDLGDFPKYVTPETPCIFSGTY